MVPNGHSDNCNYNSNNLPLSVAIYTKCTNFLSIPVGMYVYSRTCPLILITSPTTILNLPINFSCPLDAALVLTSDNLHLTFPPTHHPSPFPVLQPPGVTFQGYPRDAIFTVCSHTFTLF